MEKREQPGRVRKVWAGRTTPENCVSSGAIAASKQSVTQAIDLFDRDMFSHQLQADLQRSDASRATVQHWQCRDGKEGQGIVQARRVGLADLYFIVYMIQVVCATPVHRIPSDAKSCESPV